MHLAALLHACIALVAGPAGLPPQDAASRAIVHVYKLPATLFRPFEPNVEAQRILLEVHESLLRRDLATGALVPAAAESYQVIERADGGMDITFVLRAGVRWQPSLVAGFGAREPQTLDPRDVVFSFELHRLQDLLCPATGGLFTDVEACVVEGPRTIRFECSVTSSFLLAHLGLVLPLTPSHLYDLRDPDHPRHDADATDRARALEIQDNPHNRAWVGLGPYQVVRHDQGVLEARRWLLEDGQTGYYDPARSGRLEVLRWRAILDDATALRALIEGELDMCERLGVDEYLNPARVGADFEARFERRLRWLPQFSYVGWNLRRPALEDVAVRKALAHAVDLDALGAAQYKGLARRISGPAPLDSEDHPSDVVPVPYRPELAVELLESAGWFDRDGDGRVDRDGEALTIELLIPAGAAPARVIAAALQEAFKRIGVGLSVTQLDPATLQQRLRNGQFDAYLDALSTSPEFDPTVLFDSNVAQRGLRNHGGVDDEEVDEYLETIRTELDPAARHAAWRALHRHLADEVVPYLYLFHVAQRCAIHRDLRGVEAFPFDPGYELRSWWR